MQTGEKGQKRFWDGGRNRLERVRSGRGRREWRGKRKDGQFDREAGWHSSALSQQYLEASTQGTALEVHITATTIIPKDSTDVIGSLPHHQSFPHHPRIYRPQELHGHSGVLEQSARPGMLPRARLFQARALAGYRGWAVESGGEQAAKLYRLWVGAAHGEFPDFTQARMRGGE